MFRLIAFALVMPLLLSCAETYTDLPRQYISARILSASA